MGPMSDDYWYNLSSGEVEVGHRSDHSALMGPYPTREAARSALESAKARTEAWDAADED